MIDNPLNEIPSKFIFDLNYLVDSSHHIDTKKFILVDDNTYIHCLPLLLDMIPGLRHATVIKIKSGEEHKNINTCVQIWEELEKHHAERSSILFNLGGGVICDMGGFVASTYKRGMGFIHLPTTLTAMADASIGGKTGIDLNNIKNEIGLFAFPKGIYVYHDFLKTLSERQLLSGFAEMLKHGLIADKEYWDKLTTKDNPEEQDLELLIDESIRIKQTIVDDDPWDTGKRNILNFGHTIGHAIESYSLKHDEDPLLHGEAVAIGMVIESYLSHEMKKLSTHDLHLITAEILSHFKPYPIDKENISEIMKLMSHDKKSKHNLLKFVLLNKIGEAEWNATCDEKLILNAFEYYINLQQQSV